MEFKGFTMRIERVHEDLVFIVNIFTYQKCARNAVCKLKEEKVNAALKYSFISLCVLHLISYKI